MIKYSSLNIMKGLWLTCESFLKTEWEGSLKPAPWGSWLRYREDFTQRGQAAPVWVSKKHTQNCFPWRTLKIGWCVWVSGNVFLLKAKQMDLVTPQGPFRSCDSGLQSRLRPKSYTSPKQPHLCSLATSSPWATDAPHILLHLQFSSQLLTG